MMHIKFQRMLNEFAIIILPPIPRKSVDTYYLIDTADADRWLYSRYIGV